jgi:outer membrane biosynthesis protein TonB
MKQYLTRVACLSLPLVLAGCTHRNTAQNQPPLAPPVDDAPVSTPNNAPKNLPPPVVTVPQTKPAPTTAQTQPEQQPAPTKKHKKPKPETEAQAKPAADQTQPPQQAASGTPEVSAIGQLSTGEPPDLRTSTVNSLNDTEKGLKNIHRQLDDQEEKTAAQIREYIKQARTALDTNDIDGANTLATKAKLLLAELVH